MSVYFQETPTPCRCLQFLSLLATWSIYYPAFRKAEPLSILNYTLCVYVCLYVSVCAECRGLPMPEVSSVGCTGASIIGSCGLLSKVEPQCIGLSHIFTEVTPALLPVSFEITVFFLSLLHFPTSGSCQDLQLAYPLGFACLVFS